METLPLRQQIGIAIRERRKAQHMSQEELSDRTGLHRTYLSDVERGRRNLSLESIERIAKGLEIPIFKLFLVTRVEETGGKCRPCTGRSGLRVGGGRARRRVTAIGTETKTDPARSSTLRASHSGGSLHPIPKSCQRTRVVLASNTAWANPFGVADRSSERFGEGGIRCARLPSSGLTFLALGITKLLPVQRHVRLAYASVAGSK